MTYLGVNRTSCHFAYHTVPAATHPACVARGLAVLRNKNILAAAVFFRSAGGVACAECRVSENQAAQKAHGSADPDCAAPIVRSAPKQCGSRSVIL